VALATAAAQGRDDALVAPAVAYGASGEHAGFAGTLSIGTEGLTGLLVELVRSAGPEVTRTVFVNGHGGNRDALEAATALLRAEGRDVTAWSPSIPDGDAHAGRTETSLLLALCPEAVRLDRAVPGTTTPLAELLPRLRAEGVRAVAPDGVLGDPTGASAAEGRQLLDALVHRLRAVLDGEPAGRTASGTRSATGTGRR
jgi:creatinine amidohydrolase